MQKLFQPVGRAVKNIALKLVNNKKLLILTILAFVVILMGSIFVFLKLMPAPNQNNDNPSLTPVTNEAFLVDSEGNTKKVLVIDNKDYKLQMDLLGTWKEYLLPIDERDKYDAFLVPEKAKENAPYFYITVERAEPIVSEKVLNEELVYSLRNEFDSFKLESITKDEDKYILTYLTTRNKDNVKNYQVIIYDNGFKICFIYSAMEMNYANQRGYIDEMVDSYTFEPKVAEPTPEAK